MDPDREDVERDDDQPIFEFSDFQDWFQTRKNDGSVPLEETKGKYSLRIS